MGRGAMAGWLGLGVRGKCCVCRPVIIVLDYCEGSSKASYRFRNGATIKLGGGIYILLN